jgi:DNA polymerase/3'-5' exonuclease PolX
MDPRITVSTVDLQAQLDAGLKLRDMSEQIAALVAKADDVVRQLEGAGSGAANALAQAKDFRFRMGRLPGEQGYRIQGRLREDIQSIFGSVTQNPIAPTAGELLRIKEMSADLAKMTADWTAFLKANAAMIK